MKIFAHTKCVFVNEHVHIVDWICGDVLMICKSIPNEIVSMTILLGFLKSLWKSGCKENHFYSLPFGQAEASIC